MNALLNVLAAHPTIGYVAMAASGAMAWGAARSAYAWLTPQVDSAATIARLEGDLLASRAETDAARASVGKDASAGWELAEELEQDAARANINAKSANEVAAARLRTNLELNEKLDEAERAAEEARCALADATHDLQAVTATLTSTETWYAAATDLANSLQEQRDQALEDRKMLSSWYDAEWAEVQRLNKELAKVYAGGTGGHVTIDSSAGSGCSGKVTLVGGCPTVTDAGPDSAYDRFMKDWNWSAQIRGASGFTA